MANPDNLAKPVGTGPAEAVTQFLREAAEWQELKASEGLELPGTLDHLALLDEGAAKLLVHAPDEDAKVLALYFADDLLLIPARTRYTYTLRALEPTRVAVLPLHDAMVACGADPALLEQLLGRIARSLDRWHEIALLLGQKGAGERVAGFLEMIAERVSGDAADGSLHLPMTRREIAESLGLTIETVSRQFTKLRSEDIISTPGRARLCVLDPARLAARAGHFAPAE